jgi:hypothetical protein
MVCVSFPKRSLAGAGAIDKRFKNFLCEYRQADVNPQKALFSATALNRLLIPLEFDPLNGVAVDIESPITPDRQFAASPG